MNTVLRALAWFGFAVGLLAISLLVTWQAWAAVDFGYGFWARQLDIAAHVEHYGPQNHYRPGFQFTSPAERARLFGEIVDAIHGDVERLEDLRYHRPDGRVIGTLLRPAEIQHLRDAAALIRVFQWVALAGGLLALAVALLAGYRRWRLPPLRHFAGGALLVAAGLGALLALVGPTTVFYFLHRWLLPAGHQWFFYYEESLMSMMMKAPDLFAALAAEWAAAAVILFAALLALQRRLHGPAGSGNP